MNVLSSERNIKSGDKVQYFVFNVECLQTVGVPRQWADKRKAQHIKVG